MCSDIVALPPDVESRRLRRAQTVFYVCLGYTVLATLAWLFLMFTGIDGGLFFRDYRPTLMRIVGFAVFFVAFWMVWSYGFFWLKYWLLKREGMSRDELRVVFGSRLHGFDLESLLARYSARRLRVIDMTARRGRVILLAVASYAFVYVKTSNDPTPASKPACSMR
jgi:hypothetical protein